MTEQGVGMAVSGGGFRATLFHIGAFWRLNELGYLKRLTRVCSVSGGSIVAAFIGMKWSALDFDKDHVAVNFEKEIVQPLTTFCSETIDVPVILAGFLSILKSPGDLLIRRYDRLFKGATLDDFPDNDESPRFIVYATNLQTGDSYRFSRPYMADYRIGIHNNPSVSLAKCVAASSAFPPVLAPIMLNTAPANWTRTKGADLFDHLELRREIYLADGGIYDNLGLEAIWKRYETVLVSDAGAPFEVQNRPRLLNISQVKKTLRVLDITVNQTRALRKRHLISDFINGTRKGTYWGIATEIGNYEMADALVRDNDNTRSLQTIRTRLNRFTKKEQGQLINWGYALADAAMRRHVIKAQVAPGKWPIQKYRLAKII